MDYDNWLTGKTLIEATVKIAMAKLSFSEEEIRLAAQDLYAEHEGFDGEPTDPNWFSTKVIEYIKKKSK
jgi:hypothetical protein